MFMRFGSVAARNLSAFLPHLSQVRPVTEPMLMCFFQVQATRSGSLSARVKTVFIQKKYYEKFEK